MLGFETGPWRTTLNVTNLGDKAFVATCLNRGDCWYGMRRLVTASVRYTF